MTLNLLNKERKIIREVLFAVGMIVIFAGLSGYEICKVSPVSPITTNLTTSWDVFYMVAPLGVWILLLILWVSVLIMQVAEIAAPLNYYRK